MSKQSFIVVCHRELEHLSLFLMLLDQYSAVFNLGLHATRILYGIFKLSVYFVSFNLGVHKILLLLLLISKTYLLPE